MQEVRPSGATLKPSFGKSKTMEKTALDDAFSPMLSKTMYFGDLEQINEKVSCNYMQPTKASLAAQKQRKDKLE